MVEKLKESPKNWVVFLFIAIGLIICISLILFVFSNLPSVPYGIVDYEFAWSIEHVQAIFAAWGSEGISAHILGVWWDFLFIFGYSLLVSGCILLVVRMNSEQISSIGIFLIIVPFIAGLFDAVENSFLLVMLKNPVEINPVFPIVATISAGVKFGLLILGVAYFLIGLILGLIQKVRNR
ncbi:MAG: hypothetical protein JW776_05725 [Candidatus Lokiarchaeota archaeon]|nr:hypothetical protein [Candidatus Lokiarchaeota archaeon]